MEEERSVEQYLYKWNIINYVAEIQLLIFFKITFLSMRKSRMYYILCNTTFT